MRRYTYSFLRLVCRLNRLNYPRFIIQTKLPPIPKDFGIFQDIYGVKYADYPSGNDHVAKALFYFGAFDPWIVRTMKLLSGSGSIVCDVGANLGDTSLPLSRHVGNNGMVYCFEPLPENLKRLRNNISVNRYTNLSVCPFALTESRRPIIIEEISGQPGMAQIVPTPTAGRTFQVDGLSLDEWMESNNVRAIDVCKLDVQGHELNVMQGASRALQTKALHSVIFEHEGNVSTDEPIFSYFIANDYVIFRIENRLFTNVYSLMSSMPQARRTRDFVAVPRQSKLHCRLGERR